jgi:hypothetical protein
MTARPRVSRANSGHEQAMQDHEHETGERGEGGYRNACSDVVLCQSAI